MADFTTVACSLLGDSGDNSFGATRTKESRGFPSKKTRRKKTTHDRRDERRSYESPSSKGRGRAANKMGDGKARKGSKHGQDHKVWGKAGRTNNRDRVPRRSAQELGIKYPSSECVQTNHYWVGVTTEIFKCRFCPEVKWMPMGLGTTREITSRGYRIGKKAAYFEAVNSRPDVIDAICVVMAIDQLSDTHQQVFALANEPATIEL